MIYPPDPGSQTWRPIWRAGKSIIWLEDFPSGHVSWQKIWPIDGFLAGGLEHEFYDFPYIGNFIIPTDFHICQGGWNHQPVLKTSQAPDFLPRITAGAEGSTVAGSSFWLDRLRRFGDDDGAFGAKGLSKRVPRLRGVDGGKIGGYSISVYMFFQLRTKRQENPPKSQLKPQLNPQKMVFNRIFVTIFQNRGARGAVSTTARRHWWQLRLRVQRWCCCSVSGRRRWTQWTAAQQIGWGGSLWDDF
jgi:hypothetical protein